MNSSTANITLCKTPVPDTTTMTVRIIVTLLLGGFGVFGNIFVIVLAAKYTVRKNLHHLIINMAVSDTIVVAFRAYFFSMETKLVLGLGNSFRGNVTIWETFLCKTIPFLSDTTIGVSVITLLIISIERFRITRQTVQIIRPYTLKQRVAVLASSWLTSMLMKSYFLDFQTIPHRDHYHCDARNIKLHNILYLVTHIISIIFFFTIILLSTLTLRKLSKQPTIQDSLSDAQREKRRKRMVNAVRMVLCSLLLYSCCYLPLYTFLLIANIAIVFRVRIVLNCNINWLTFDFAVKHLLLLINSCLSPCIYLYFLADFREAAKRIMCEKTSRRLRITRKTYIEPNTTTTII